MNAFEDALTRVLARHQRRAVLVRTSNEMSSDPAITIGIATIKIVTEEQIQAIAFGALDHDPQVIARLNPIGRDVADLMPFAKFLNDTFARATAANVPIRIWVAHSGTLEALDVLGHRYWRNQNAPEEIRRMGENCRVIAHEATIPGQQLVADAAGLLHAHVVTGLNPLEEGHLGATLAWFEPGIADPLSEARARIRIPASGVLPNTPDRPFDDRVDRLRKEAKGASGAQLHIKQSEISDILRESVLREWQLLVDGRRAFLALGLPTVGLEELLEDSNKRVQYALANGFFPARAPDRLAAQLGVMEAGQEKQERAALEHDPLLRDQSARAGGVVRGVVSNVIQTRAGFKPCDIEVESEQDVIRFRIDDKIVVVGTNVTGIVRGLSRTASGGTSVQIEIKEGVRTRHVLTVGAHVELMRAAYAFVNFKALKAAREQQSWIFYGANTPLLAAGVPSGRSALAIARATRR
ncbi:hypothetical protein AB8A05_15445 [Tardiphaga sp. 538_B7_N1_4]|uniref:hypothetical protein n=1 Tax=Tardiphaga sp. 538_B7_N1_4 TaxID=3240778 RepID=UPI003F2380ED